jgi:hypothetical protein
MILGLSAGASTTLHVIIGLVAVLAGFRLGTAVPHRPGRDAADLRGARLPGGPAISSGHGRTDSDGGRRLRRTA